MTRLVIAFAMLGVLGCAKDPAAPPVSPQAGCAMVAEKIWDLLVRAQPTLATMTTRRADVLATLAAPCAADAWPAPTLTCFAELPPGADIKVCSDGLAPAARKHLKTAVASVDDVIAGSGSNTR